MLVGGAPSEDGINRIDSRIVSSVGPRIQLAGLSTAHPVCL
jgi:hypothetical protein